MSLINREALYEEACDLEAQALSYVGKIANDETKIEEWKIWSAILIERTGFKHDIFDAPEELPSVQPEIVRCKDCKHFEYDHLYVIQGVPVLGHEVCSAWGDGCKTDENGYCFLAERRTDD